MLSREKHGHWATPPGGEQGYTLPSERLPAPPVGHARCEADGAFIKISHQATGRSTGVRSGLERADGG